MANVYSHSFLTVCAAQGDSCQSGFLKRHSPSQVEISFHSSLDPSVAGKYSLRKVPGLQHSRDCLESGPPKHPFAVDVRYSSWNSRGWTFQEVKLSPRALTLGTYMTYLCVTNIYGTEDGERQSFLRVMGPRLPKNMTQYEEYIDWYSLVELYTSRSLIYHDDILVAISAVAKRFSTNVSGKYLAGLWSDNLHHGLMWVSTHRDGDRSEIKSTYTAPSWSWACQPGPVTFHKSEGQVYQKAKVLTAETSFTVDPYGQITDGFVLLSAKVYKISSTRFGALRGIPNEPFFRHDLSGDIHSDITLELSLVPREGEYTVFVWFDQKYKSKKISG